MTAEETILDYYEALRRGEPLYPYFAERPETWKAAISTTYDGYDAVGEALREQTRTTEDWTVESRDLSVTESDAFAVFDDDVTMEWTHAHSGERYGFDARWSGTLVPVGDHDERDWRFLQMHVSAAQSL